MFDSIKILNWGDLLQVIVFLALVWVGLYFLRELFRRTIWFGSYQKALQRVIDILFLLFEPITLLLLITTFVFIKPVVHGLILLLVILGAFSHFKNYISGRIVRFDDKVKVGKKLKTGDFSGVIAQKERLGMRLKTSKGLQFIGYSKMMQQGYMLLADNEIGGFYALRIRPLEDNEKQNHLQFLENLFISAPYLDHNYKPETEAEEGGIRAQIAVREKQHLNELCSLIAEQGYNCIVLKK